MTRLHPAAPAARTLRALMGLFAVLVLALAASGCDASPPPTPTPDPFGGLADRADQAFAQGLKAYADGQFRDALTSFEQARLLSPSGDPRIAQMIEKSQLALAPAATPVPPVPTPLPAPPTVTPVPMSTQAPDTALGTRYFGEVTLGVVPSTASDVAPAATRFYFKDQIGLHIEALRQQVKLPFSLRIYNRDSGRLVAEVQSDGAQSAQPTSLAQPTSVGTLTDASATAAPEPTVFHLVPFWTTFVWYQKGGEEPGQYTVQLFANGVLTNNFEYSVGSVPIPVPSPTPAPVAEPTFEPVPDLPTPVEQAAPVAATQPSAPVAAAPVAPMVVVPTLAPTSVPEPTPTIVPTPAQASSTIVGGLVAGLDVDSSRRRFYLADTTGVIWSSDIPSGQQPAVQRPTLNTPFNIGARLPVDLAVDRSTGYLYLSTRVCAPAAPGCVLVVDGRSGSMLKSISLAGAPADLRVDSDLGLVYVSVPERQALVELDVRSGNVIRTIDGLPQITSLALDPIRHTLYAAHLAGQVTVLDVPSGRVMARLGVTGAGLSSVATARGLAYAVNTATHELAVLEPVSQTVSRYPLTAEPAAVTASEDTGAVYVLSSRSTEILQVDPTTGFELGRVLLASRSGHPALTNNGSQTLRPRIVIDDSDQTVFASLPEAGTLAAVTIDELSTMANQMPSFGVADQGSAESIPGVVEPAPDGPAAQSGLPAPVHAQTPDEPAATPDEEGL